MSRLASVLTELGVSQGELSRRTGLTPMTIRDAYYGRSGCSLATWVKIARALQVPLCRLSPEAAEELRGLVVA
jgi:transcriptional regulator with XRE-family HTH domain